jgi:flagellar hook-basal body complex protein FliE
MSDININQVLQQMRSMAAMAEAKMPLDAAAEASKPDFGQLIKDSINAVNNTQKTAADLTTRFDAGDPSVNLSEVMVAVQKASVSFQAMTQVRNNLVSAYKDIMNMQV